MSYAINSTSSTNVLNKVDTKNNFADSQKELTENLDYQFDKNGEPLLDKSKITLEEEHAYLLQTAYSTVMEIYQDLEQVSTSPVYSRNRAKRLLLEATQFKNNALTIVNYLDQHIAAADTATHLHTVDAYAGLIQWASLNNLGYPPFHFFLKLMRLIGFNTKQKRYSGKGYVIIDRTKPLNLVALKDYKAYPIQFWEALTLK